MKRLVRIVAATAFLGYSSALFAEAWLYKIDSMSATELDFAGAFDADAYDINDLGEIVGWASYNQVSPRALLYRNGTVTWVTDDYGSNYSWAQGINNHSEVVGYFRDPDSDDLEYFA